MKLKTSLNEPLNDCTTKLLQHLKSIACTSPHNAMQEMWTAQNPTRLILRVVYRMNFPTVLLQSTASHSQWQPIVYNPWQILFQTLISFQYSPLDGQEL